MPKMVMLVKQLKKELNIIKSMKEEHGKVSKCMQRQGVVCECLLFCSDELYESILYKNKLLCHNE